MKQNFTDSIQFYQAAYKMHPKFGGNFAPQSFAGFVRRRSNFESICDLNNFTGISMQINFVHTSFKVALYSACYLTNGDYIRYVLEKLTRENKVIAAVKKWKCFQF